MPSGPESSIRASEQAAADANAAKNTAILTSQTFTGATALCTPGTGGALTAIAPVPPLIFVGQCTQTSILFAAKVAQDIKDAGAKHGGFLEWFKGFALEVARILLKKVILDKLVDALITWINHDGKGGIIENWSQFFNDAAQNAVGEFANQIGAGKFLCSPFNLQVQLALLPVPKFSTITCTLNTIIGNINGFLSDFRNGSWLSYQETLSPQNNFYGGTILAMDLAASEAAKAQDAAASEAAAGQGFLSFTKDDYFIDNSGIYKDKNGTLAPDGYTGIRYTKAKRTVTPGSIAAQGVTEALFTIPGNRIIHADDMSAYITAILNASINRLTIAGVDGLKALVGRNTPNDLDKVNFTNPCKGLTGSSFTACLTSVNAETQNFQTTQTGVVTASTASLSTRVKVADTLNQAINLQQQLVDGLTALAAKNSSLNNQLANEQATLTDLQNKLADNQTFIDGMFAIIDQINSSATTTPNSAVSATDWSSLSNSSSTAFVNDTQAALDSLTSAQADLAAVTGNVNTQMTALGLQLATSTPSMP